MPKILTSYLLTLSFLSTLTLAQENDIIATITQGAFNQNSQGVRELSKSEMEEVKGGLLLTVLQNGRPINEYVTTSNCCMSGKYIAFYGILMTEEERSSGRVRVADSSIKNSLGYNDYSVANYFDFKEMTFLDPQNEVVTIKAVYDYKTHFVNTEIVILNKTTKNTRKDYGYMAQRLNERFAKRLNSKIVENHAYSYWRY